MFSGTVMDDLHSLFADIDCGEMQLFPLAIGEQTNSSTVENQQQQQLNSRPSSSGNMNLFRTDTYTSFIPLPDSPPQPSESRPTACVSAASPAPLIPITVEEVNSTMASDRTRFVPELGCDPVHWDTPQHTVPTMERDKALRKRRGQEARGGGRKARSGNIKPPCASGDSPFRSTQFTETHFPDQCSRLVGGIYQSSGSCTNQNDSEASSGSEFKDSESVKLDKRRKQNKMAAEKCRQKRKVREKQLLKDLEEAEKSKQQKMQEVLPLLRTVQRLKALLQNHQASGSCCLSGHLQSPIDP